MAVKPGTLATDTLTDNKVYIVQKTGNQIDEQVATYDYNKNEITVYDLEKEKEYGCSPEDEAVEVVYPDRLEDLFGTTDVDVEKVKEKIEIKKIKPYYFPETRLE